MVCSHCQGAFTMKHNSRTCPLFLVFKDSEAKKVTKTFERLSDCASMFKEPKSFYTGKKVTKTFDRLADCASMFKEPKSFYEAKKVTKTFERLADCASMFKEPKVFYEKKKVTKTFDRLADCSSMFKEPKVFYEKKKVFKICSMCGIAGHNKRTCVLVCMPCIVHADMPTKAEVRVAQSLSKLLC